MTANGGAQPSLSELREAIDELDDAIVSVLSKRFALAASVARHKRAAVQDEAREAEVLARVERLADSLGGNSAAIRSVYLRILQVSVEIQAAYASTRRRRQDVLEAADTLSDPMPIYEYRCPAGHTFERFPVDDCARAREVRRLRREPARDRALSRRGALQGLRVYSTDYGKKGKAAAKKDGGESGSSSGDSGSSSSDSGSSSSDSGSSSGDSSSKSDTSSKSDSSSSTKTDKKKSSG